jgi:hypothetical protein
MGNEAAAAAPTTERVTATGIPAVVVKAPPVKGWRTSEFWITIGFSVATELLTAASHVPGPWGMLASAGMVIAYNVSRGMAKS